MTVTITSLSEREFFAWYALFAEYAADAGVALSDEHVMRVWTVLQGDGAHGLVAHDDRGDVIGLAHFRAFDRLLRDDGGFLVEDLYVAQGSRRAGVATALVEHVRARAEAEGRGLMRWSAREDDPAARALQQKFADAAGGWVLQTVPVG